MKHGGRQYGKVPAKRTSENSLLLLDQSRAEQWTVGLRRPTTWPSTKSVPRPQTSTVSIRQRDGPAWDGPPCATGVGVNSCGSGDDNSGSGGDTRRARRRRRRCGAAPLCHLYAADCLAATAARRVPSARPHCASTRDGPTATENNLRDCASPSPPTPSPLHARSSPLYCSLIPSCHPSLLSPFKALGESLQRTENAGGGAAADPFPSPRPLNPYHRRGSVGGSTWRAAKGAHDGAVWPLTVGDARTAAAAPARPSTSSTLS